MTQIRKIVCAVRSAFQMLLDNHIHSDEAHNPMSVEGCVVSLWESGKS